VAAGACADAGVTALETVSDAVARTLAASTARSSFTVTAIGAGAPSPPERVRGAGAFDLENRIGSMHIAAVDLRVPYVKGEIDAVVQGAVQLLSVPPTVPLGKPWIVVDHRTLGQVPVDPLAFDQLLSADPSTAVRWLRGASGDVKRAGEEVVRGVPTTRFEVEVGLQRAAEQAPSDLRTSMGRLAGRFGIRRVPAQVWVGDDDDRVHRLTLRFEPAQGGSDAFVLTVELYDFGVPVTVARPTPDRIAQLAELLQLPPPRPQRRR
jgi:hypothetical protein